MLKLSFEFWAIFAAIVIYMLIIMVLHFMTWPFSWRGDKAYLLGKVMICALYVEMEGIIFSVLGALGFITQVNISFNSFLMDKSCFMVLSYFVLVQNAVNCSNFLHSKKIK